VTVQRLALGTDMPPADIGARWKNADAADQLLQRQAALALMRQTALNAASSEFSASAWRAKLAI
jgi:hypothetical protein